MEVFVDVSVRYSLTDIESEEEWLQTAGPITRDHNIHLGKDDRFQDQIPVHTWFYVYYCARYNHISI